MVIGLGGGSAIDAAKAVAGMLTHGGAALDYLEVVGAGRALERAAAPMVAIPTTAGTGSEVTRNAVLTYRPKRFKASMRSEHLMARIALVDPALTDSAPPDVTASTGLDALTQLIEPYVSKAAHPLTDGIALQGVRLAARALRRAWQDGGDQAARDDMALASLLGGICLANAGLGAVHGFAAPLGARYPVPHGCACAALLPHVMAANVAALRAEQGSSPTLARYAELGEVLTGRRGLDMQSSIDEAVRWVADLVQELGIPKLSRYGLGEQDVASLVADAKRASSMRYNPVDLSDDALASCLRNAV
jgi:alcohol dehydrogenase class IV